MILTSSSFSVFVYVHDDDDDDDDDDNELIDSRPSSSPFPSTLNVPRSPFNEEIAPSTEEITPAAP